jgi:hypothetical protein
MGTAISIGSMTTTTATISAGPQIVFSRRAGFGAMGRERSQRSARRLWTQQHVHLRVPLAEPMPPDYNDLDMYSLRHTTGGVGRFIRHDDYQELHHERLAFLEDMDEEDVDARYERRDELTYPDYATHATTTCVRNNWGWTPRPACNNMHETSVNFEANSAVQQTYDIQYLNHGYYRDTWLMEPYNTDLTGREFIVKTLRLIEDHKVDYYSLRKVEKEAVVMERLTKSDVIVDIYGHCGTSIIAEAMPGEITLSIVPAEKDNIDDYDRGHMEQSELDILQKIDNDVHPMNNLTLQQKVDLALLMAESLAELHGFKGGLIIHGDVHPDQWLKTADGRIKLK